jgi:hypothetical protein
VAERTGFAFAVARDLATDVMPTTATLAAIRALDPENFREPLVG